MKMRDALRRISFKIGTIDDIVGKAINPIIQNRYIVDELNTQLQQYANITKGIQDVYSFPSIENMPIVEAPTLALRSEAYFYAYVVSRGTISTMDMRGQKDVYPLFRYNPVKGISNWFMPWNAGNKQFLSMFPTNNLASTQTQLTNDILSTDTTISVVSTTGYIASHGRITIGNEKILYEYKDTANFYGCTRGVEMTTATNHSNNENVLENNFVLFYSRLPMPIIVYDDDTIDQNTLNRDIEIIDEHMEGIVKAVAYNLLVKIDPERAVLYRADYDELYKQYKLDIKKGYYRGRSGTNVRDPYYMNETGMPFATNLM